MADLNIMAGSVLAVNASTVKAYGTSGAAITAGQVVYADPSSSPAGLIKPAQANSTTAANVVGVALDSTAGSLQPVSYATSGDIVLPTSGAGSVTLTQGSVYVLSANSAGGIASANDPAAGTTFITPIGLAVSPTVLRLGISPVAATR